MFVWHENPEVFLSNKEPQFPMAEFANFARAWDFSQQTCLRWNCKKKETKRIMKKHRFTGQNLYLVLLEHTLLGTEKTVLRSIYLVAKDRKICLFLNVYWDHPTQINLWSDQGQITTAERALWPTHKPTTPNSRKGKWWVLNGEGKKVKNGL